MDTTGPTGYVGPYHHDLVTFISGDPLDADPDKNVKPADHNIVISKPINSVENKCSRQTRTVNVRPFPNYGFSKFKDWLIGETWDDV